MDEKKRIEIINALDWPSILKKLHAYALARNNFWPLPPWTSPDEIVNEAIYRLLNGTRNWDPEKYPDCIIYLKCVIKSLFSHALEKHRTEGNIPDSPGIRDWEIEFEADKAMGPEQDFQYKEALDQIEQRLAGNEELLAVFYGVQYGYNDQELAVQLGVDVTEIRNRKKRMRRGIRKQDNQNNRDDRKS